jgi:hypothetical protein
MRLYFFRATQGTPREEAYVLRTETLAAFKAKIFPGNDSGMPKVLWYDTGIGSDSIQPGDPKDNQGIETLIVDDGIIKFRALSFLSRSSS